MILHLTRHVGR